MISDIIRVYKTTLQKTIRAIKESPQIILVPLIGAFAYGILMDLLMRVGILNNRFGYLFSNLVHALILSEIFFQFERAVNYNTLTPYNMSDGVKMYLIDVYSIRIVLYLLNLLLSVFTLRSGLKGLILPIVFIILNPISEMAYIRGFNQIVDDMRFLLEYMKDNWYLWLPQLLVGIYVFYPLYAGVPNPLSVYLPGSIGIGRIQIVPIVYRLLLAFYLVFRGVMFKETYRSSRSKRDFQGMM